jgi:predicted acyltransferase
MTQPIRYLSLDIFRGLTIALMILVNTPGSWSYLYAPLAHAKWNGCTPTDWVFPSFLFIVGVSMRFSFAPYNYQFDSRLAFKILKRGFLIFLIGILLGMFPFFNLNALLGGWLTFDNFNTIHLDKLRIMGVLQRIGLSYAIAGILATSIPSKHLVWTILTLLLGYWALLFFGGDAGQQYEMTHNLGYYLDLKILQENHLYHGEGVAFDPEGLLSTMTSVVTVLCGYWTGKLIQEEKNKEELVKKLLAFGAILLSISILWDFVFPINKKIWTSSYVVHMAGINMLILGILIAFIDVGKMRSGFTFFNVLGSNSMLAYIVAGAFAKLLLKLHVNVTDENGILKPMSRYNYYFKNGFQGIGNDKMASFLFAVTFMLVCWATLYVAYRKKWFLKV